MAKKANRKGYNYDNYSIVNSLAEPVLIVDNSVNIFFANKAALKLFEYPSKSTGKLFLKKILPCFTLNTITKIRKKGNIEITGKSRKGNNLALECSCSVLKHGRKNLYLLLFHDLKNRNKIIEERDSLKTDINEIKNAEKQILAEKNRAELYFQTAGIILMVIDKYGVVQQINKKACEIIGVKEEEIKGRNWFDAFVPRQIREELRKKFKDYIRSGVSSEYFEYKISRKDGSERIILWHNSVLKDEKGMSSGLLCSGEDITGRKQMEELLRISERKYRELARNAPVGVTRLDAASDKYEFVNEEFVRQSGYNLVELNSLSKRQIYEMVLPGDRDALYSAFKKWVQSGFNGILHKEYRMRNKHGEILWLDAYFYSEFDSNGELTAVNQLYIDISERKKAEERLHILGHAIESTTEMICITDLDNRLTFVNRAFQKKYGYNENELTGKEVEVIGSVKNPPEIHEVIFRDTKKGGWEGELINTSKDGHEFPVLLSTSGIKNKKGEVLGYIGVARDITELKNTYDRLRHSLKEKDILLKEVYHRVKNNMQVISSLLSIQSQSVNEPAAAELLKETQNRVRIMQLIHEKLYRSQDLSKIDFSLYIRDLTDQLRRAYLISKNIELTINSEDIFLGVDKAIPCGLIINELVSNAYKHAFKEGNKGKIYIELTHKNGKYFLEVSDDGIGIPLTVDFREADSLGMILISTLSDQLDAKVEIDRSEGTKFSIVFD